MNLIEELKAIEASVKGVITKLIDHVHAEKAALISEFEGEIAKGSAELQAAWSKLKGLV